MSSNCPGDDLQIQTAHNSICPWRCKRWEDKSKGISLCLRKERGATEPFSQSRWSSRIAAAMSGEAFNRRGIITTHTAVTYAEYLRECTEWKISAIWSTMASTELIFLPARLLACIRYCPSAWRGACMGRAWAAPSVPRAGRHQPVPPVPLAKSVPSPSHGCCLTAAPGMGGPWPCRYSQGIQQCRAGVIFLLCIRTALAERRTLDHGWSLRCNLGYTDSQSSGDGESSKWEITGYQLD